ncbi:MAG: prepilin-type N-terminal cleavage/methylation domain-containing protein [Deferribacteraceae bacterium]|jgi:prepilin-type N-terminal cleavage/methylation domain-containing protein|nr:prepilin-type N-terminal cleavage/methylation domain-containing protein [Deferribacteraceae bacterium]
MGRKGFTLVELAIVLLIIGLILGLAVKGGTLIDSARIRSEVRKLEKFQTALSAYVGRMGALPSAIVADSLVLDKKLLIEHNYLNEIDLNTDYKDDPNVRWNFVGCASVVDTPAEIGKPAILKWDKAQNYAPGLSNICVTTVADNFSGPLLASVYVSDILSCSIENMLDDLSYQGGSGRLFDYGSIPAPLADNDSSFENCLSLEDDNVTLHTPYGYKIY